MSCRLWGLYQATAASAQYHSTTPCSKLGDGWRAGRLIRTQYECVQPWLRAQSFRHRVNDVKVAQLQLKRQELALQRAATEARNGRWAWCRMLLVEQAQRSNSCCKRAQCRGAGDVTVLRSVVVLITGCCAAGYT